MAEITHLVQSLGHIECPHCVHVGSNDWYAIISLAGTAKFKVSVQVDLLPLDCRNNLFERQHTTDTHICSAF